MRNITLIIEYDGTDFVGWQRQKTGRSVQAALESVLHKITGGPVALIGAGRTDSGVHATGQCANFKTGSIMPCGEISHSLNGMLPDDIVIHSVTEVPEDFSARFSAKGRIYSYSIARNATALMRKYSWRLSYPLDVSLMKAAAAQLVTVDNFSSFCKSETAMADYRCTVADALWYEYENGILLFRITARRFLHGMVRALVGTMVDIGRGRIPYQQFASIIASHDRRSAGMSAPSHGLTLEKVIYEDSPRFPSV